MHLEINKIDDCSQSMLECYDFHSLSFSFFSHFLLDVDASAVFLYYLIAYWVNIEN